MVAAASLLGVEVEEEVEKRDGAKRFVCVVKLVRP